MGFDFTKFEEKKEVTRRILTPEEIKKRAEALKQKNSKEDIKDSVKEEKKDNKKELNKSNTKKKAENNKNIKEDKIKDIPIVYSRPRSVFAYGEEIYIENDVNVSLEDIRDKLANEYGFSEFRDKEKCTIIFNAKTGEVYPEIKFQKKG